MKKTGTAFLTFSVFSLFIIGACSASKETAISQASQVEKEPIEVLEKAMPDTSEFIQVTINERVQYSFIKTDTSWSGTVIQFDSNNPTTRKALRTISLIPTYGWSDFDEMVEFLGIYTLPDQKDIPDRKPGPITDLSREYKVIVKTGGTERSYGYFNPEGELTESWQSQNIVTFSTYLINEMKGLL